ncbi:nucleotidyltransferase domain-containing protein [bacterium]|nr:nucleotidyltransferase domain-containing protein [bacterium]
MTDFTRLKYDEDALKQFAAKHNIMLVILYGSRAEGTADEDSDWDIAVMPKHRTHPEKYKLLVELDFVFECEIDSCLIDSDSDPLLRWEVFRVGLPLYEDEPWRFDDEYILAWKIFLDTEKFRRLEREIIREFNG